jgi:sec-independent protein translocase protein TatA
MVFLLTLSQLNIKNMESLVILGAVGAPEIIVILIIVVLLFGGRKIPELMKGIGEGMREFKKASREGDAPEPPAAKKDDK